MNNKITVIGSSNIDLLMKMNHLPALGETVTDAVFQKAYGGKGANQAVAAARAGGEVYFVNCVGEDDFTPKMLESYRQDKLHLDYVFQEKGIPSGTALIMIGDQGDNYLSVAPGANYRLTPEYIDKAIDVLKESGVVLLQYEILAETIAYVIEKAAEYKVPVIWNFAPARSFDLSYLNKVHYLVVNEVEAEFLTQVKVSDMAGVEKAAQALLDMGVNTVVLTLGSRGAYYRNGQNAGVIDGYSVDAVDTTAAGDVFCGCLSTALVEGKSLPDALQFANAAGALAVTKLGAQPSAPTRFEIEQFIKNKT